MTVRDLMTLYPKTLDSSGTVQSAARLMRDGEFSSVPIVDQLGTVVGIVSDWDIVAKAVAYGHGPNTPIREVMSRNFESVGIDTTIEQTLIVLAASGARRLLVMDNSRLVGIVTRGDIVRGTAANREKPDDFEEPSDYSEMAETEGRAPV